MNKILTKIIALGLLVTALPAFADIEWGFPNNSTSVAGVGDTSGNATISVGNFNTGWHDGIALPWNIGNSGGGASGFWDLGISGSILLSGINLSGTYTLKLYQWIDNPIYTGDMTYNIGAGNFGLTAIGTTPGNPGGWQEWDAQLTLAGQNITITAPGTGAIVDRVMLTVVPEPATMIAGALLLLPFAFSTIRIIRKNKSAAARGDH